MKYFRAVSKTDIMDEFYVSCNKDVAGDYAVELLGLDGYNLFECSKNEFDAMTQEENDYILYVGHSENDVTPFDSAPSYEEGICLGRKYLEDWEYVELVYMPNGEPSDCIGDDGLIDEGVVWFKSRD